VTLGPNPSLTVRDFVTGSGRDPLYVTGLVLPPAVQPGDPPAPAPLTVAVKVFRGGPNSTPVADSAAVFPGPGGFGAYQLFIGRVGPGQAIRPGDQLRVVLYENGGETADRVAEVTIRVPALTGEALVVTAADLVGQ